MSLIDVSNLTFSYEGSYDNIFENASFRMDTTWRLGFVGRNGRGKTTFLNLLLGKYPYSGTITANVDFEYFPYCVEDKNLLTSEVADSVCPCYADWQFIKELSMLKVSDDVLYRPFNTLSNGEQTKVLLAALFLRNNSFLLLDEPTNHLDMEARAVVSKYLKSKKGFILVSHDRAFLDDCIDHVLSINKVEIQVQKGNFSSWMGNKERSDNFELAENERLRKDIKRLETAAVQSKKWADKIESTKIGKGSMKHEKSIDTRAYIGEKSRRMQQRRKNLECRQESAIQEKSGLLKNVETSEPLKIHQADYHTKELVKVDHLSLHYGPKTVCENISFTIETGDRIALCGRNGSGKSAIIKLICGEDISYDGSFYKGSKLLISYVPQDASSLQGGLSAYAVKWGINESIFKAILRKLDFSRIQFDKDMSEFSEGQKKKVLLAKSLCEKTHLHIWDEPLNFIDVISRMQLEELLLEHKPTILFVEHDRAFCENIANKKIFL